MGWQLDGETNMATLNLIIRDFLLSWIRQLMLQYSVPWSEVLLLENDSIKNTHVNPDYNKDKLINNINIIKLAFTILQNILL